MSAEPLVRKRTNTAANRESELPRKTQKDNTTELGSQLVEKKIRRRIRIYCCTCEGESGRSGTEKEAGAYGTETTDVCLMCGHPRCLFCLQETMLRREHSRSSRPSQSSRPSGQFLESKHLSSRPNPTRSPGTLTHSADSSSNTME